MTERTDAELAAVRSYQASFDLAIRAQILSKAKYDSSPNDIVRDALFVLSHDAICVHQAIGQLVFTGWSSPAAPLVRTLLDLTVSMLAILNGTTPPLSNSFGSTWAPALPLRSVHLCSARAARRTGLRRDSFLWLPHMRAKSNGLAYCRGSNGLGPLGDGTQTDRQVPTPVAGGLSFV